MKSLSIFLFLTFTSVTGKAGVDSSVWKSIGSGRDNATYQNRLHSDQLLTVIETEIPESLPSMDPKEFQRFIKELKVHRKSVNENLGHRDWKLSSYSLKNLSQGQKVFLSGTFKRGDKKVSFFETHYYQNKDYRNYQLVESKDVHSESTAFKILDQVAGDRIPAEQSRKPDTADAGICSAESNRFLVPTDSKEHRVWKLLEIRQAYDAGDNCAKELIASAIDETHERWIKRGQSTDCVTEDNLLIQGESCSSDEFKLVGDSLALVEQAEEGLELANIEPSESSSSETEGACATGTCDQSLKVAAQPVNSEQLGNLADVSEAIEVASTVKADQCSQYAPVGSPARFDSKLPSKSKQALDCVMNAAIAAAKDLAAPFVALWNWGRDAIKNRTMISGIADAVRSLRDPAGLGSKFINNLIAHFTDRYEGFDCYNRAKQFQLICESGGQLAAFFFGGKGLGAGARATVKGASKTVVKGIPRNVKASIKNVRKPKPAFLPKSATALQKQKLNYRNRYKGDAKSRELYRADRDGIKAVIKESEEASTSLKKTSWFRRTREQNLEIKNQKKVQTQLKQELRLMEKTFKQSRASAGNYVLPAAVIPAAESSIEKTGSREQPTPQTPTKLPDDLGAMATEN